MHEDYRASSCKNQIGATGKLSDMCAKAIAKAVNSASDEQFGFRVRSTDTTHKLTACLWCHYVGHIVMQARHHPQ